jgi:L-aspartate oxidase
MPNVTIIPFAFVQEFIVHNDRVAGARFIQRGDHFDAYASACLVASGGAGQIYSETTNPPVATGDGFALGYRAGARLRDMEFVQFHPTALRLPGVPPFLISEAVRGEGAHLIDETGSRFVDELAPRDIVARAIYERLTAGSDVRLDVRHLPPDLIRHRFPHIHSFCLEQGIDITRRPLPVTPAAHYFMGGLYTDVNGRTSLPGLFAAGEAASVGIHGANRLASNSLLECVVFGKRAASAMAAEHGRRTIDGGIPRERWRVPDDVIAARKTIRDAAWRYAGIAREAVSLAAGADALTELEKSWSENPSPTIEQVETANMLLVAKLVMQSAIARQESRGAHYRKDFPLRDDLKFKAHSWVERNRPVHIQ